MTRSRTGIVIVNFSRQLTVETSAGTQLRCRSKGRELRPVCGDQVAWEPLADGTGLVVEIKPRRSLLVRHDLQHAQQPLAANVDRIIVVAAPRPDPEASLLDRYLVAAEALNIPPLLLLNKTDLLDGPRPAACEIMLQEFMRIGYQVLEASARSGTGLDELRQLLRGQTGVVVGQSGVGKTSLLKALVPEASVRISEISRSASAGRHTTSATVLYHLPGGGELIDSPGVRGLHLWPMPAGRLALCFVEFRQYIGHCRFSDCAHLQEPGCAVKAATETGAISMRRYENYRTLCTQHSN